MLIPERAALFVWIAESGSVSLFMFALFYYLCFLFSRLCSSFCGALEGSGKEKDSVCQIYFVFGIEAPFIARLLRVSHLWYGSRRLPHRKRNAGGIPHP